MNVQLSPLSTHPAATMLPLPQFLYINIHVRNYLEPGGAFQFLSTTHPCVRLCRRSRQQGPARQPLHFRNTWRKGTETDILCSTSFHFCWSPVVFLEHKERSSRDGGYSHIQSTLQVSASISCLSTLLPCPSWGAPLQSEPGAGHREGQRLAPVRAIDLLPKYPNLYPLSCLGA